MKRSLLYSSLIALVRLSQANTQPQILIKVLSFTLRSTPSRVNGFSMNLATGLMLKLSKTPNLLRVNMGTLFILRMIPKIV